MSKVQYKAIQQCKKRDPTKNDQSMFINIISKFENLLYQSNIIFLCLCDAKQPTASKELNKAYKFKETSDCL